MLTEPGVNTPQLLVVSTHATRKPAAIRWYLLIQILPVVQLQLLQRPILPALLTRAAVRLEPVAIGIDQILLEQLFHQMFRGDTALELFEDILAARMREDVLCSGQLHQLLGGRLTQKPHH